MTAAEFQKLPPRERDAIVAERVMGWTPNYPGGWLHPPKSIANRKAYIDKEGCSVIQPYSTDIAAAWEVVNKITLLRVGPLWLSGPRLYPDRDGEEWRACFSCEVFGGEDFRNLSRADSAPLAICTAALKAVSFVTD